MIGALRVAAIAVFLILTGIYTDVAGLFIESKGTVSEEVIDETIKVASDPVKRDVVANTVSKVKEKVAETADTIREAGKVITSEPLRVFHVTPESNLTIDGIIIQTNVARALNGLPPLTANTKLQIAAQAKAQDMLEKQYFAHESPDGKGPSDVIEITGYEYLVVGENLAMGLFKDDNALVEAWMESPGHRENILKNEFQEIGVGIVRGTYKGDDVWFAVQEFGRPQSDCPAVDRELEEEIQVQQAELETRQQELERLREEIESSSKFSSERRRAADEYNEEVEEYNELVAEVKSMIDEYNAGIQAFNICAGVE